MKDIVNKLILLNKTISTMESCTGGGVANAITNIEGASAIIKFSAVTYSNEYKIKMGVSEEIINKYTVYSMETANEMSKNISLFANSNYGIGITGQINRFDPANTSDNCNKIYISIYDKDSDLYYNKEITAVNDSRENNKKIVIDEIIKILTKVLESK